MSDETRELHCGAGCWGGSCLSTGGYVTGMGAARGATAAGER